ncbi:MAG: ATP-binding protein [Planctomycetaceae bacterium]
MSDRQSKLHELLLQNLTTLNLTQIAATYREVLDEAARRNTSMLAVLSSLVASEVTARRQKALQRRILPGKTPKAEDAGGIQIRIPQKDPETENHATVRLALIEQHQCAIFIGPIGHRKSHLMTASGYVARERGITVRFTRVIERSTGYDRSDQRTLELALVPI